MLHGEFKPCYIILDFYHENCNCLEKNGSDWVKAMKCPATFNQIDKDLSKLKDVYLKNVAKKAVKRFGQHHALVHYAIIKNEVQCICFQRQAYTPCSTSTEMSLVNVYMYS